MIAVRHLPIEEIIAQKNFIFEIGSESCSIKFCREIERFMESSRVLTGKKFRLVTPKVPQAHVEKVVKRILSIIELLDIDAIIINDYGVLYELRKSGVHANYIFGRLLVRCQEYELNYKKRIDPHESKEVLQSWLNPSILHTKKIEFLKKMNFSGVELSPSDSVKNLLLNIKEFDLDVHVHYNSFVGAIGRACVAAKYNNVRTGNCFNLCDNSYNVKLSGMYGNFEAPTKEEIDEFTNNAVIGNIIYFLRTSESFPFEACKDVILDARINNIKSDFVKNIFYKLYKDWKNGL